jgi:hypothetical protein
VARSHIASAVLANLLFFVVLSASGRAQSQQPAITNADTLEANPNRPSSSNSAEVLAPGVLQIEYGWSREWEGLGANGSNLGGELRFGLINRVELRWGGGTFLTQFDGIQSKSGFGDQYLSGQAVVRKESPRVPTLALSYAIKFPTASESNGLGTGRTDHTFTFLASKDIHEFTLDFNAVTQILGREGATGFDRNGIAILTISHTISGPLSAIGEVSGETRLNQTTPAFAVNLWALTYRLHKRFVVDCAFEVGLTPGAPQKRILFGFTYAIAKLGHGR